MPLSQSCLIALIMALSQAFLWSGEEIVRVTFGETEPVTEFDTPIPIRVEIENRSDVAIGGEVTIGGPTTGIRPVGEITSPFSAEPGQTGTAEFEIAFDETCLSAWYPIHAFVTLSEGRDDRVQGLHLIETHFENEISWSDEESPSVKFDVELPKEPLARLMTAERLATLSRFVRGTTEFHESLTFRLGEGLDSIALMILPGDRGLLDGLISFVGPNADLHFQGIHLELETPHGIDAESEFEILTLNSERVEGGLDVWHHLQLGELETEVTIEIRVFNGAMRLRAVSPDPVRSFGLGPASSKPTAMIAGLGHRFDELGEWEIIPDSPLLKVSHAGFEFEDGLRLLQSSQTPIHKITISPANSIARVETQGSSWLALVPHEESLFEAALTYRDLLRYPPAAGVKNLAGRFWLEATAGHYADLTARIEELSRYGVDRLAFMVRDWQRYGQNTRLPDVWPPNETFGTLTDFQFLAKACRDNDVLWGVEENYGIISPGADQFSYDSVAFSAKGRPKVRREVEEDDLSLALRPDQVRSYLDRNLKHIRYYLTPNLFSLTGPMGGREDYFDQRGRRYPAKFSRALWRETMLHAQSYLGQTSACVSRGGGDWLLGAADGAGFEIDDSQLPGACVRVPWFSLVHHARFPVYEMSSVSGDRLLVEEAIDGRLPTADHTTWGRQLVRKAWLMQPVAGALTDASVSRVALVDENPGKLRVLWDEDRLIWANRSPETWNVSSHNIPSDGFWIRTPEVIGGIELRDGVVCEQMLARGTWYANARPRHDARVDGEVAVSDFTLNEEGNPVAQINWKLSEPLPVEARPVLILTNPEDATEIWFEGEFDQIPPANEWTEAVTYSQPVEIDRVYGPSAAVSIVLRTPNGRAVRVGSQKTLTAGRYAGWAIGAGTLNLQIDIEGKVGGLGFRSVESTTDQSSDSPINTNRQPVDFEWSTTNGAFRAKVYREALRVTPLPDSPSFELKLRLSKMGLDSQKVVGVIARNLFDADWAHLPVNLEGDTLTLQHDPRFFSYDVLLEP